MNANDKSFSLDCPYPEETEPAEVQQNAQVGTIGHIHHNIRASWLFAAMFATTNAAVLSRSANSQELNQVLNDVNDLERQPGESRQVYRARMRSINKRYSK